MWIFFPNAMLSIVAHRDDPDLLMVRARFKGDIERVFPRALAKRTPTDDYLYRATLDRRDVAEALKRHVAGMTYTNVKGAIPAGDLRRHNAMTDIWQVMFDAQHSAEPFARLDGAAERGIERAPTELRTGCYYAHTTAKGEPRTVYVHQVQERMSGELDVTLEYQESGWRMTAPLSQAEHWLRNAVLLP